MRKVLCYQLVLVSSDSSEHSLRKHPGLVSVSSEVSQRAGNMRSSSVNCHQVNTRLELVHRVQYYLSIL